MPINRSPPTSAKKPQTSQTAVTPTTTTLPATFEQALFTPLSSSEPALNRRPDSPIDDNSPNITFRNGKRRRLEDSEERKLCTLSEMKQMFQDFKIHQDEKYEKLFSLVNSIRESFDHLSAQHDNLKSQIDLLEAERKENLSYISELENKLDKMEQSSRSTCLEIRNIPSIKEESKSSLLKTVIDTGSLLNLAIQPRDVKDVFRIKTKDPANKTIIVDFTTVILKEEFLVKFRNHNKSSYKLTTEHLKITGPAKQLYVSENLSAKNKRLFFLARDAAKTNEFQFCWVSHGKILVREKTGCPHFQVQHEADIGRIKKGA